MSDFFQVIRGFLLTPGVRSMVGYSKPGQGKTSRMTQLTSAIGINMEVLIASIREPSDIFGMQIPRGNELVCYPPDWAVRMSKVKAGVVFLDEHNNAPPAVQAASLRPLCEGYVGDLDLRHVKWVAMCNPSSIAVDGHEYSPPVANRFFHYVVPDISVSDWVSYINDLGNGDIPDFPMDKWDEMYVKARQHASAFLMAKPDCLSEDPEKIAGRFPMAYASPRSWENATRLYATGLCIGDKNLQHTYISGCVGEHVAGTFMTYIDSADLPDPEDLLSGRAKYTHNPSRPDKDYSVINSVCVAALSNHPKFSDRWRQGISFLMEACESGILRSAVICGARVLLSKRPSGAVMEEKTQRFFSEIRPILAASQNGGA